MAITNGSFSDIFKSSKIWEDFDKAFNQNDFNDSFAYSQLQSAQNQMAQQYAKQYQGILGRLGQAQQVNNGIGGYNGLGQLQQQYDYAKQVMTNQDPAPILAKLKKPSNEAWLDSKVAEVSFVL